MAAMTLGQHRILYIEDHEDTRDLIALVLTEQNYEVTTDGTIEGALRFVATQEKFDLYILDSRLPDGSGLDLCKKLRGLDSHTPILFYSAAAYELDKKSALAAGAQGYLVKPVGLSDLCDQVSSLIQQSAKSPAEKSSQAEKRIPSGELGLAQA
jgi:DNA-binding response OmpR family regulator